MIAGEHIFWITSRAAGGAALILASAAVGAGLMVSAKRQGSNKRDLRAVHEALSLTTLAMVALHGLSLLGDSYLNPGLTGIAIPFVGFYRPLWTGLGIVAGYGLAALGLVLPAQHQCVQLDAVLEHLPRARAGDEHSRRTRGAQRGEIAGGEVDGVHLREPRPRQLSVLPPRLQTRSIGDDRALAGPVHERRRPAGGGCLG